MVFLLAFPAAATELTASVDKRVVNLGEEITLTLTISGATRRPGSLGLPAVDGFSVQQVGTSTQIVNKQVSYGYRFLLTPLRAGTFEIPSFSLKLTGERLQSRAIQIRVVEGAEETKKLVVRVKAEKEEVYVGEAFCVSLTVGLGRERIESFTASCAWLKGLEGLRVFDPLDLIEKWTEAASTGRTLAGHKPIRFDGADCIAELGQEEIAGAAYTTYTVRRLFVAKEPGEYVLSPAAARARIVTGHRRTRDPFFNDPFFGPSLFTRKTAVTRAIAAASDEVRMTVKPLPPEARPERWGGVGRFTMKVEASPTELKLGETITLKATLTGRGDLDTLAEPALADESGFLIGEPEIRKEYELRAGRFGGTVEFVRPLRPKSAEVTEIPEVSLTYFDVKEAKYVALRHPPIPISVAEPEAQPLVISAATPARGMKVIVRAEGLSEIARVEGLENHGRRLHATASGWMLFLLPPAAFAGLALYVGRARRLREDVAYRRRTQALARALASLKDAEGAGELSGVLAGYVADRINRAEGEMPAAEAGRILRERGLAELAGDIEGILSALESARFAGVESSVSHERAKALLRGMEDQWRD